MPVLTATQNEVFANANEFQGRYRVLKGSAGSGKSVDIAQDFILKLGDPRYKGANLLALRKTNDNNRSSTLAELTGAIYRIYGDLAHVFWKIKQTPLEIVNKKTGNSVIFRGMADERQRERIKSITAPGGGKICWIWVEEATEFSEDDIDMLDTRMRGVLPNPNLYYQMTLSFNPVSAQHWLKRRFFDTPRSNVLTHQSTYLDNAFCDEEYNAMMLELKEKNPEYYQIYGLGDWGETGGLILTNYTVESFDKRLNMFDALGFGTDFGFNHAHATLLLGWRDGEVYVLDEVYVRNKDIAEIASILSEKFDKARGFMMYCDAASPEQIKALSSAGWNAIAAKKGSGSVLAQISWLQGRRVHIHPDCKNTIGEVQQWKWLKDRKTGEFRDEPVNFYDDAMAALRYGVEPWRIGAGATALGVKAKGW